MTLNASRQADVSARSQHARRLFAGIAQSYEWLATILSLGQDPRWRTALVATVRAKPGDRVLDCATGTGMVARALARAYGCRVVGLDQSAEMLTAGSANPGPLVRAQGERLPFGDESFDHVTCTYLLRYVDDPAAAIRELARVLNSGGRLAVLEFGVPQTRIWFWLWRVYTRIGLPLLGGAFSPSWRVVGEFLGPSIERLYSTHPPADLERYWREAGLKDVAVRRMSLGGGIVTSATKARSTPQPAPGRKAPVSVPEAPRSKGQPSTAADCGPQRAAFYALRRGGWRDYWTLLHPPYTAWHLSYVLLGAAIAPVPDPRIVLGALAAFGLAVGVGAHAFDELQGRPLGTRIPSAVLLAAGVLSLAVAAALGVVASTIVGTGYLAIVGLGVILVATYGLEIKPIHSDVGFGLAWGGFPVVATGIALGAPPLPIGIGALGATLLSLAQRRLSTPVRAIRRRAVAVSGEILYRDGSTRHLDAPTLLAAPEGALGLLWAAAVAIGSGVLAARWV
jgi:ubiquinone/menaquinone biosynthesis methyltransferase